MDNYKTISKNLHEILLWGKAIIVLILSFLSPLLVLAQSTNPVPVQFFYVPLPENQILQALQTINTNGTASTNPVQTYISIAAIADNTVIYYDQWENGFDPDISNPLNLYSITNPGGTQIWGDGNTANGAPPGIPSDIINSGTVIILNNPVTTTTRQSVIDFDGGDRIAATKTVSVARTGWTTGPNTLLADAIEVYDTESWGTDFRVPVGENIPNSASYRIFSYTGLSIMAGFGGATVQIDADANGSYETTVNLSEGQAYLVNGSVNVGARILSSKPVHITLLTGDRGDQFEARWFQLLPTNFWSTVYYEPVSTPDNAQSVSGTSTVVWLYNPNTSSITVKYTTRTGSGGNTLTINSISVSAGGYARQVIPDGYGAKFFTEDGSKFFALSVTDANNSSTNLGFNRTWDWGFALVPESALTPQVLIGLGIGRDPTSSTNPNENGNPIYVTPIGNGNTAVTIYVDYDANPLTGPLTDPNGNKYDVALNLRELDRAKVYNPSGNQTGMLLYTLTPGVKLAAAWGQDPLTASAAAPGLDVGSGIPPLPLFDAGKNGTLYQDNDGDGFISPGDELIYKIVVNNISRAPVPDLLLFDNLPANTIYVPNTTFFKNSFGVTSQIPDNGSGTAFPLDEGGKVLDPISALPVRGSYEVTFRVKIKDFEDLETGTERILNAGYASAIGTTINFSSITPLYGRIGDFVWDDINQNGIQDLNEPGIQGVTVKLYDGDGNLLATTTTDANGYYIFLGLLPGNYQVEFVNPSQYDFTIQNADSQGLNGPKNSDANPLTGKTGTITLAGGEPNKNIDAGLRPNGSIGDKVWNDTNKNGIQDAGEDGLPGIVVKLYDCSDNFISQTTTNTNGNYNFSNLAPGSYYILFILPDGYSFSPANQGTNDDIDSDANITTGKTDCFTLGLGETIITVDAGMIEEKIADVRIEKTANKNNPNCGENVVFTIKVTNDGPEKAKGIEVTDLLPQGLVYVSSTTSQGSFDSNTGKWIVGDLNNGSFATLSITAKVDCDQISSAYYDLGVAKDFNLFVFENLNQPSSDTQGKLAVGGNAYLANYSVGDQLPPNSGDVLIVGGTLTYISGAVYNGNVVYGVSTNLPQSGVSITGGTLRQDNPIDFAAAKTYLQNLSTTLGGYSANGNVALQWGGLTLTGTDPYLNVFSVNGSDLSSANNVTINAPNGSVVLVNINGTNVSWSGGLSVNGTAKENVLFNFYQATNLTLQGIDVRGSILAPFAALHFPSGVVNGQVIVKSMAGSGQFNSGQFNQCKFLGYIPYEKEVTNFASITSTLTEDPNLNNNSASVKIKPVSSSSTGSNGNNNGNNNGNWQYVNGFAAGEIVYTMAYSNNAIYAGTWGGKIYKSTNQGQSWTRINNNMFVGFIWSLAVDSDNLIFAATEQGVYKFNGSNWTLTSLAGMDVHSISIGKTLSIKVLYAGTWGFGMYKSTDMGTTWTAINNGFNGYLAINSVVASSANIAYAASFGGGVYVTINGGGLWTKLNVGYDFVWSVAAIPAINPLNTKLFAGTYGDGLYRSLNGGTTWSKVTTLNAPFIYSVVVDNSGKIYVASWTTGVFSSSDNGDSWTSLGMGGLGVSAILVNLETDDVYIGTKEGKIFLSKSGGLTSVNDNDDLVPTKFELNQNYPNPFNPSTVIRFVIPESGRFMLRVYNILGQEVATLVDGELRSGIHKVNFDASRLSSGVYIYKLTGNNVNISKKMILAK